MTASSDTLVSALKEENIEVTSLSEDLWVFQGQTDKDKETYMVGLTKMGSGGYFVIFIPVSERNIEELSARQLRGLIKTSSTVMLAKLDYVVKADGDGNAWIVRSECSLDNWTGQKLKRRIEACLKLADKITPILKQSRPE